VRSRAIWATLVLRGFEVFALAIGATLGTRGPNPISQGFGYAYELNDGVAFAAIVFFSALMMFAIWRETRPGSMLRSAEASALTRMSRRRQTPGDRVVYQ
jgi:hypothetical protein